MTWALIYTIDHRPISIGFHNVIQDYLSNLLEAQMLWAWSTNAWNIPYQYSCALPDHVSIPTQSCPSLYLLFCEKKPSTRFLLVDPQYLVHAKLVLRLNGNYHFLTPLFDLVCNKVTKSTVFFWHWNICLNFDLQDISFTLFQEQMLV